MINIIFLRVSKQERNLQDLEPQKKAIIEKYNPNEPIILEERGSAYNLDKLYKRKAYLDLIDCLFNANTTTIKDLFLQNIEKRLINLYVWDYHRIMRNFQFNLLFGLLCDFFTINIISYKQGQINKSDNETPLLKFSRYIFYSINAFSSEDYSYNISTNIKKTIEKKKTITISNKGNKWGMKFSNPQGEKVELKPEKILEMNNRIKDLAKYYKKRRNIIGQFYYSYIIEKISIEFNVMISKSYISKLLT